MDSCPLIVRSARPVWFLWLPTVPAVAVSGLKVRHQVQVVPQTVPRARRLVFQLLLLQGLKVLEAIQVARLCI